MFITPVINADVNGEIKLELFSQTGGYAYINAIQMEEYGNESVPTTQITVSGSDITVTGESTQMKAAVSPANATIPSVTWTVSDPTVATIDVQWFTSPFEKWNCNSYCNNKRRLVLLLVEANKLPSAINTYHYIFQAQLLKMAIILLQLPR